MDQSLQKLSILFPGVDLNLLTGTNTKLQQAINTHAQPPQQYYKAPENAYIPAPTYPIDVPDYQQASHAPQYVVQTQNTIIDRLLSKLSFQRQINNVGGFQKFCLMFFSPKNIKSLAEAEKLQRQYNQICFIGICTKQQALNSQYYVNLATETQLKPVLQFLAAEDCQKADLMLFLIDKHGKTQYVCRQVSQDLQKQLALLNAM